ncbi:MAG: protease modulator HflC [Porticoccus sp.]|jgi:membrane protease subunit HflC|uniref:protease modulator HflC n=1 Tax=Porticoccus sp. Uisw_050_02 TaxID=3230978 RepID=UPI003094F480|tara:strand:- start:2286 stop:3155 length:870 start_codon:yes stop_codon:yes gene_type:complete
MTSRSLSLVLLLVLALVGSSSLYVIQETELGVKLRFGRLIETDIQPGLHYKIPFVDQVRKFDGRVLTLDADPASFFTIEKKRLIVDAFSKWRIIDVDVYYRATGGNQAVAQERLASRVNDGLRNQFGARTLHEVVSGERDQLMKHLADKLNLTLGQSLGVEVVDVRVKGIDLPPEVSEQVYRRMKAEREKEARILRSEGRESAEKIRADADRQKTILLANAYRIAEETRGQGDATATSTYAAAYTKNPEFYAFIRSLSAYRKSFANKGDVLLVDPKSDFFRYLNSQKGE